MAMLFILTLSSCPDGLKKGMPNVRPGNTRLHIQGEDKWRGKAEDVLAKEEYYSDII